ncbi:MAG TPA: beta-ketoacyl-ACP synthase II [Candidatus Choladousia intestinavium]|uniref:3-oxoacyl-[acyl-carrier-protein] synthase 2 n=1 Tax=Candidatus Choladousia intestinavium TaxID=2840727 RepID=A0A9D1ACB8_9FIRM|nr:beta-ketoacyl-ACP synthase II [Candidatus Choladousia intestinavium]
MKKRVVVTGMGVISPIGNTVEEFWQSLKEKRVGIGEITHYDASEDKVKLAAEVKNFDPKNYMDPKSARRMELFSQYAVAAAGEAIGNAGLDLEKEDRTRIGVSVGCGIGSLQIMEQVLEKRYTKGFKKMPPLFVPLMITNMAAGNVAIHFGLEGTCVNVVTACATGTHSIGEAFRAIQWGDADVMIAGGTEAAICPTGIGGFHALTAVSTSQDPLHASMPFDRNRSGFVMGEGAGVVVLESLEHAEARGAKILAEVGGFGSTCDAYHITSPKEDGSGAARAMLLAAEEAGLTGKDIQYVNAHGTGTHHNDLFETRAIKKAFGDDAYQMNVNSTKSMTGHMLGAAGAVEFIACVKTVMEDYIHATAGFEEAEEEMDLNYTKEGVSREVTAAISNSLGFGGHNGSLLVKKYIR